MCSIMRRMFYNIRCRDLLGAKGQIISEYFFSNEKIWQISALSLKECLDKKNKGTLILTMGYLIQGQLQLQLAVLV